MADSGSLSGASRASGSARRPVPGGRAGRPRYDCDVLVVGGGIVGLATAHALRAARPGLAVTVLEKEPGPARHQTGRNSGVIHSGVYYRPGSLKARFAVTGGAELVSFCAEHDIPHALPGKVIVATSRAELPRLGELARRARSNRVPVRELGPAALARREPHVRGLAALHVQNTGVCDFTAVADRLGTMTDLRGDSAVLAVDRRPGKGVAVRTARGEVLRARVMVNCAGLYSDRIARLAGDDPGLRIVPFRGEYYTLRPERAELVHGLVYPVPDPAFPFLGVHLTTGWDGQVHVGPNAVLAMAREGYRWSTCRPGELAESLGYPGVWRLAGRHWRAGAGELHRSLSRRAFTRAVRRLLPAVTESDLLPAPAGVRAQAVLPDGTLADDFRITEGPHTVHVLNAPSPAATACFPIGREVADRVLRQL
ncbi:L-2-hydroxyglutarate oxidase [Streptomyces sp. ACA25]|uniref:L-2-hydroxyglutarate oxidase n=1 Tax=Streptomyces sp. ACA25 TaxID=3022596 RepID=UPI00230805D6|nr:L-2-hydroxyglutarate oxidase [Streptomyces sp. ACA25]MDB1090161.1 L-2-hydroxyglutarate oxidase [Streptomyces sp. ACA25]